MGWLFAVALGLHRKSRAVVMVSLAPILIGHAVSIGVVLYAAIALGFFFDERLLMKAGGLVLIGWAGRHFLYGHRHRVRVGMVQTGLVGLGFWSLLMATAHGAGLMMLPAALPLCLSGGPGAELTASGSLVMDSRGDRRSRRSDACRHRSHRDRGLRVGGASVPAAWLA